MSGAVVSRLRAALDAAASGDRPAAAATLRLAARLGVAGLVRRLAPSADDPPEDWRLPRLADRLIRETVIEVSGSLSARGVPHFVFKGAALLGSIYEPGDRAMGDLDLMVPPNARGPALAVLSTLGFRTGTESVPLRPSEELWRPGLAGLDDAVLDLHWGLEPVERLFPRAGPHVPAVWQRVTDAPPRVPDPADHAAILVHQLVHHDLLHLRSFVDLALLWERGVAGEIERFLATARALGVERVAVAAGHALHRELGLPLPEPLARRRPAASVTRLLALRGWLARAAAAAPGDEERLTLARIARRTRLLDRRADVPGLLLDAAVPPSAYLRWRWPAERSAARAWLRHVVRVVQRGGESWARVA